MGNADVAQVGYVEIYNEEVRDLLHLSHTPPVASLGQASAAQGNGLNVTGMGGAAGRGLASRGAITIREDAKGRIIMAGASIRLCPPLELPFSPGGTRGVSSPPP